MTHHIPPIPSVIDQDDTFLRLLSTDWDSHTFLQSNRADDCDNAGAEGTAAEDHKPNQGRRVPPSKCSRSRHSWLLKGMREDTRTGFILRRKHSHD